jgi:hypothetical protein
MARPNRLGNTRDNYLLGTAGEDWMDAGAGNDYLRGFVGNDLLTGGEGSDRFAFERTLAANGLDTITDFQAGVDLLDFTLVGFSRGTRSEPLANLVRVEPDGTGARLMLDVNGGGNSFEQWATLEGVAVGQTINLVLGGQVVSVLVTANIEIGVNPNTSVLSFDLGNGDRTGNGVVNQNDYGDTNGDGSAASTGDAADEDDLFDDRLAALQAFPNDVQEVLIGDRVKGLTAAGGFVPGVTQLSIPPTFDGYGDDEVDRQQFEVYYGTYDVAQDIFTVTSTPDTTQDPTSATHTMILYDNDADPNTELFIEGLWFEGVYAEQQWYITDAGTANAGLHYDTDGLLVPGGSSDGSPWDMLDEENVIYGGNAAEVFDGNQGIDIIYANGGNDRLYGGGGGDADWLVGGLGNDTFIVTNQLGVNATTDIDWVKDLTANDEIIFAPFDYPGLAGVVDGTDVTDFFAVQNVSDVGPLDGYGIGGLQSALEDYFDGTTELTAPDTVYQVKFAGKDYLIYDALGEAFGSNQSEWVVEITGVAGVVSASQLLVNLT